jgi:hypothetical protein
MKDALERIVRFIPAYVGDLLRLLQAPKTFIAGRLARDGSRLQNGLVFLGVSFLVGWVLKASFIRQEPFIELASDAAFVFCRVLGYGAALCVAWRIVQGRAPLSKFFAIHFYYSGVLGLIETGWFMAMVGVLRVRDADFYSQLMDAVYHGTSGTFIVGQIERLQASHTFLPLMLITFIGLCVMLVWIVAGWGAYRKLNHLSKLRSALAATLFAAFCVPVTAMIYLIANAAVK